MRRHRVIVAVASVVLAVVTAAAGTASGTWASYTDVEAAPGSIGAATVVFGAGSRAPSMAFAGQLLAPTSKISLTIVYAGTTPARITMALAPAATATSGFCTRTNGTWARTPGAPATATVAVGTTAGVDYCTLLNGGQVTLASSVAAGSSTTVDVTTTFGILGALTPRTDTVPLVLRAVATAGTAPSFTDTVTGNFTIAVSLIGRTSLAMARAAPAPTPTPVVAVASTPVTDADVPPECAAAGMTARSFADVIRLGNGVTSFDAARERPGVAGPFLVLGSPGADTVTGSDGADCIAGLDGDDVLAGGGGADVILGGAGADRIDGGAGDDRLYGGPGIDDLTGGPGADLLDGGPDGARCTTEPADTTVGCLVAEGAADTPVPTTAPPVTTEAPVTTTPPVVEPPPAPVTTDAPVAPATPEGAADPALPEAPQPTS
ncbi:MAG: hypothetical protein EKK42_01635 [Pseudonocardiaceae bacterium]|nr:MAG: hypothetical protein EKK42_01635 [Pseudonocardiaceae bacterium]